MPQIAHEELGDVAWHRDFEEALALSQEKGKPLLILFQEVPGCATCRSYGQRVLTHPLIVEAIETEFVPLAIFNNKKGKDAEVLRYYTEPSWNNPVVRIVNAEKENLIPRIGRDYSRLGLVRGMTQALRSSGLPVPEYLELLQQELRAEAAGLGKVNFSMYCFWTGEKELGQIDGVIRTRPGFMDGREVVEVAYDPVRVSLQKLTAQAQQAKCASRVYVKEEDQKKEAGEVVGAGQVKNSSSFRLDKEPKYYLFHTAYRHLPMTHLQAVRANALIGEQQSPEHLFSPRQLQWLREIKAHPGKDWPVVVEKDLADAWRAFVEVRK